MKLGIIMGYIINTLLTIYIRGYWSGGWGIVERTRQWHSDQSWPTDTTYIRTNRLFSSAGRTINLGRNAFRTWLIVWWLMRWRDLIPDLNEETWEKRWSVNKRKVEYLQQQPTVEWLCVCWWNEVGWGIVERTRQWHVMKVKAYRDD